MDARLADFVGLLRQNGLRVSPAEVADAARATLLIGVGERDPFRSALRATLVKRGPDAPVFDRLFDLYFLGVKDPVDGLSGALLDALAAEKLNELELEEAARRVADREQKARDPEQKGESGLLQRNLASLSPAEVERMRAVVRRLAERLKSRLTRKRKVRRRGVLSVRRTLRKNLSTGGFPARLVFRSKRPERPEILVLCDVSDSVRNVSRLMLQFVYTLQELYARVRSFVFVSEIGEVTHLFKKMDVSAAVDLATASRVINVAANSNYGHALKMFHTTWLGSVARRSTVIVIGDGRTNYNPPNAWVLGEVKRKARRVIWLCPEDAGSWGFGDR